MRIIKLNKGKLFLRDDKVLGFIEKRVTPTGNSAKVDVPRRYLNRRAYVVICKK
jgi:putative transposon-encoded protein